MHSMNFCELIWPSINRIEQELATMREGYASAVGACKIVVIYGVAIQQNNLCFRKFLQGPGSASEPNRATTLNQDIATR
jgi:hypothetical protein